MDEREQGPPPATPGMEAGTGIPIGTPTATATDFQATAVGVDPMERVNLLAVATGQLVWTTTLAGAVEDSPSWRAFTGQSSEQMRGWGWLWAVHADDRAELERAWTAARESNGPFAAEYRVRRHDGVYRHFMARGVPAAWAEDGMEGAAGGAATGWIGTSIDITERKEAEERLKASHEELRAILESITDAFFALDAEWRFTYINAEAERVMGRPRKKLLGNSILEVFPRVRDSTFYAEGQRAVVEWMAVELEEQIAEVGKWFAVSAYPARDGGLLVYFRDITERKRADEERSRLEQRTYAALAALLEMAEALVQAPDELEAAGDEMGNATEAGVPGIGALGRRLAELTRQVLGCERVVLLAVDAATGRLRPLAGVGRYRYDEAIVRRELAGAGLGNYLAAEYVARLRAGEVILTDLTAGWGGSPGRTLFEARQVLVAPMRVGRELMGVLALDHVSNEHTYTVGELALAEAVAKLAALVIERERLLREREEARASAAALRQANQRMDEFLDVTSHELRTPLTVVKANVQILSRLADAGTMQAQLTGRTLRQVDRLTRMVNDLLDVTRIQAGKLDLHLRQRDLGELVHEAVEEQRQVAPERRIELAPAARPDEGLPVRADADRIGQVLTNYLTNALKYSPADRPIWVELERMDGMARVAVRDEGPGLEPEQQARVWERFHRAPGVEVLSGPHLGLGLGLFITRQIVERHGGAVGVESVPEQGCTFWFTLPLATS
jgi:PAS domain S-box-containing protein